MSFWDNTPSTINRAPAAQVASAPAVGERSDPFDKLPSLRSRLKPRPQPRATGDVHPDLLFQLLHIEVRDIAVPTADITDPGTLREDWFYQDLLDKEQPSWEDRSVGPCAVYIFGVTADGRSVCVVLNDFRPWFYMEHPHRNWTAQNVTALVGDMARRLKIPPHEIHVKHERRCRVFGWEPKSVELPGERAEFVYTRFSFPTPCAMKSAAKELVAKKFESVKTLPMRLRVCEQEVQSVQKVMQQSGLCASGWVRIPSGAYADVDLGSRSTSVQLEVMSTFESLHPDVGNEEMSRMLVAAVDIEAQSGDFRSFPDFSNPTDVISYIGTTFYWVGEFEPCLRVMQVLGDVSRCKETEGMVVESYATELELLVAWRDLIVVRTDPDKIVSYNGTKFDYEYMFERYQRCHARPFRFLNMGRFLGEKWPLKRKTLSSAAFGDNELSFFEMPGRYQMDLFLFVKNNYKLSSYKLDAVCAHFLTGKFSEVSGKVVLDYPRWVADETRAAWDRCAPLVTLLKAYQANETQLELAQARFREALDLAESITGAAGVGGVGGNNGCNEDTTVPRQDQDLSTVVEAENHGGKWEPVHALLTLVRDHFAASSEMLTLKDEEHAELASLLKEMTPALDASGDDNYRKSFRLFARGPGERARVAQYCQVDCDLLIYLLDRLSVIPNTVKMSQVTFTLLDDIANRGQQIKVFNLIYRFAAPRGFVVNTEDVGWDKDAEYVGATVIEPTKGYYTSKIATLDFASLYPSIMRGHNLCYSSLVMNPVWLEPETRAKLEVAGARFENYHLGGKDWTFQQHTKGILPMILEQLLTARTQKKREMKQYDKNSMSYRLCDAAQLALKVSCNSVYGFTGVLTNGMLSCMPIANATTCIGRDMIHATKAFVEREGFTVVYGDTDSVMVDVGCIPMHQAFDIGKRLAIGATALFPDTVQLEFEKVFYPYLLIKKKMYTGMKYEDDPSHPPKLDVKGLALARRDNCKLLRDLMRTILQKVMRDCDATGAYLAVKTALGLLASGNVPLEDLEISKTLKANYANDKQPHLTVVANMKARKALDLPQVGDRVPFVVVQGTDPRMFSRAEHPKYVKAAGLKVDRAYYLENQLKGHILRIMTPMPVPSVETLFQTTASIIERERLGMRALTAYYKPVDPVAAELRAAAVPLIPQVQNRKRNDVVQRTLTGQVVSGGLEHKKPKRVKRAVVAGEQGTLMAFLRRG